jgi:hypothetical protein
VDPLGLDFINHASKPVCAIKDGAWRVIGPGVRLIGDVDAIAAPKGPVLQRSTEEASCGDRGRKSSAGLGRLLLSVLIRREITLK